jgi:hypothetical protein
MPAGRDDPCPCGSGKKFKKCCLHKERQQQHERWQQAAAAQGEKLAGQQDCQPALVDAPRLGDADFDSDAGWEDKAIYAAPTRLKGQPPCHPVPQRSDPSRPFAPVGWTYGWRSIRRNSA